MASRCFQEVTYQNSDQYDIIWPNFGPLVAKLGLPETEPLETMIWKLELMDHLKMIPWVSLQIWCQLDNFSSYVKESVSLATKSNLLAIGHHTASELKQKPVVGLIYCPWSFTKFQVIPTLFNLVLASNSKSTPLLYKVFGFPEKTKTLPSILHGFSSSLL